MRSRLLPLLMLLVAATVVACGGGGANPSTIAVSGPSGLAMPSAYLAYPPGGAYAAPAFSSSIVVAERGLNASYAVVLSPNPLSNIAAFPVSTSPTSLPSPLTSPPPSATGTYTYAVAPLAGVTANGIHYAVTLRPVTTYTVSLVGCPVPNADGSCTTTQTIPVGSFQTDCGLPPPTPPPFVRLDSPANGATGVATNLGQILVDGNFPASSFAGSSVYLTLTAANGTSVAVGPYAAAPTPANLTVGTPPLQNLVGATIPALASATKYAVSIVYPSFAENPPSCIAPYPTQLGTFTTQ